MSLRFLSLNKINVLTLDKKYYLRPGNVLNELPVPVGNMRVDTRTVEKDLGHLHLVILDAEHEGGVPGPVPGVPLQPGVLTEELQAPDGVSAAGVLHRQPGGDHHSNKPSKDGQTTRNA